MQKYCKCGRTMNLRLRTVIYQSKVDIENVPIYSCEAVGEVKSFLMSSLSLPV